MVDNSQIQPTVFNTQSDSQGNWGIKIDQTIAPGPHVVSVEDPQGNSYQVMMYVLGDEPTTAPAPVMPLGFLYAFYCLLIIIAVLIAYVIKLARQADKENYENQATLKKKHYTRHAILFCVFAVLVTLFSGVMLNRDTNFLSRLTQEKKIEAVKLSGVLIDPLTLAGVADVDLANGTTKIKTPAAGQFIFGSVSVSQGLRLTYPRLTKALILLPPGKAEEEKMNIYFEVEMFNSLIAYTDFESRGQFNKTYEFLPEEAKAKTSLEHYMPYATTIFKPGNVPDQELRVASTRIIDQWYSSQFDISFPKAVEIKVSANGKTDLYYLIKSANGWQIVK